MMRAFKQIYLTSLSKFQEYNWLLILLLSVIVVSCSKNIESINEAKQKSSGEKIYISNCKVCHAQGINGAPILGNQKMWSKRLHQEIEVLIKHAEEGYGLMPAKGGNSELTNEDISVAVRYMIQKLD